MRNVGLLTAALALAGCSTQTGQDPSTTIGPVPPSSVAPAFPTTTVTAELAWPSGGPIEAGAYHIEPSESTVAGVTLTMPEGWVAQEGLPYANKHPDQDGESSFQFVTVDSIYSDPCVGSAGEGGSELVEVGPSVDDLVNALLEQPHTVTTGPADIMLGGLAAKRIDLAMADEPGTATCNINVPGGLQIWYSQPADAYFVLGSGTASVYILDVNGERQVLLTQVLDGTTAEDLEEMQTIIDSIRIDT